MHTCIHVYIHVYIYKYKQTNIYIYIYTYTYTHIELLAVRAEEGLLLRAEYGVCLVCCCSLFSVCFHVCVVSLVIYRCCFIHMPLYVMYVLVVLCVCLVSCFFVVVLLGADLVHLRGGRAEGRQGGLYMYYVCIFASLKPSWMKVDRWLAG